MAPGGFAASGSVESLLSSVADYGSGSHLNLTTSFSYDTVGDATSITDPNGNTTQCTFDPLRRLTQITLPTPFSYETQRTYDDNSNVLSVQSQTGNPTNPWQTTSYTYLPKDQLLSVTDPLDRVYKLQYDSSSRLQKSTDAQGNATTYSYDPLSRPYQVTGPSGVINTTNHYTTNGLLKSVQDGGGRITCATFDGFDRPTKTTFADTSFEAFTYDANSNVLSKQTRSGNTITLTYDPLNRVATKSPTGEAQVTYSYDLADRLLSASTPVVSGDPSTGTFELSYDTAGRLIEETTPDSLSVQYGLDSNGNMTKLTWPDSYYVNYQYDQLSRPTGICLNGASTPAVTFGYDALSRRILLTYANGAFTNYRYNLDDTLSSLNLSFPFANTTALNFNYNQVGQKTMLGVNGNLPVVGVPPLSGVTGYAANSVNEYTTVGSATPTYDGNGNLTGFGPQTFSYDTESHLLSATKADTTTNYEYDPFGRQTLKSADSTRFLFDSDTRQIADYESGTLTTRHIFGPGLTEPLIDVNAGSGALTYLHADAGESIVATSNSAGNTVNTYSYSPFGGSASLSGTTFGYAGQRYDAESGFYYCRARYFAPILGRFLQTDPAGPDALWNPYTYVTNDPLNLRDPLGLDPGFDSGGDVNLIDPQYALALQLRASELYAMRHHHARLGWGGHPLQGLSDLAAGFGDRASFGLTPVVRISIDESFGTNGTESVDFGSLEYAAGQRWGGKATNALIGLSIGKLFGPLFAKVPILGKESPLFARTSGLLNSNDLIRIGWGWSQPDDREVFRISIGPPVPKSWPVWLQDYVNYVKHIQF